VLCLPLRPASLSGGKRAYQTGHALDGDAVMSIPAWWLSS
jgi:hypothetical protein